MVYIVYEKKHNLSGNSSSLRLIGIYDNLQDAHEYTSHGHVNFNHGDCFFIVETEKAPDIKNIYISGLITSL